MKNSLKLTTVCAAVLLSSTMSFAAASCHSILKLNGEVSLELFKIKTLAAAESKDLWNDMELFYAFTKPKEQFRDQLFKSQAEIRYKALEALEPKTLEQVEEYTSLITIANLEYIRNYRGDRPNSEMFDHIFDSRKEEVFSHIMSAVKDVLNPKISNSRRWIPSRGVTDYLYGQVSDDDFPAIEPDDVFDEDNIVLLNKAMQYLNPREKEIYILHKAYGLSEWGISYRLNIRERDVTAALKSAKVKIQDSVVIMQEKSEDVVKAFIAGRVQEERSEYKENLDWFENQLVWFYLGLQQKDIVVAKFSLKQLEEAKALSSRIVKKVKSINNSEDINADSIEGLKESKGVALEKLKEEGTELIGRLPGLLGIEVTNGSVALARRSFSRLFQ